MQKILIVQSAFLGDIVLSSSVISGIKDLFPDSEIYFLTTKLGSELVENNPNIKDVIIYDKKNLDRGIKGLFRLVRKIRSFNFERVYSIHKSYRTAIILFLTKIPIRVGFSDAKLRFLYTNLAERDLSQHEVLRSFSILRNEYGFGKLKPELDLYPKDELSFYVKEKIKKYFNQDTDQISYDDLFNNTIILSPGSIWETKRWHSKGFNEVAKYLENKNYKIIFVGSKKESDIVDKCCSNINCLNLAGDTNLSDLMLLIKKSKLLICNDSLVLHIASAFKTPTVAIFCATSPKFGFGPIHSNSIVIEEDNLECKPCSPHGAKFCPLGINTCMTFSSNKVIMALERIL